MDIGDESVKQLAQEYAVQWDKVLNAYQHTVLADGVAELITAVLERERLRWEKERAAVQTET